MTASYDWLIVGAGYTGCVLAERLASERGEKVLLVDRRSTLGGNAHDHVDEHGVLVHRYGPHFFHTNSKRVWDHLSRFTEWHPYEHRVRASIDGKLVPVPFNLAALHELFPPARAKALEERLVATYGMGAKVPILKLRQSADADVRELAEYVYEKVFLGYTTKQWDLTPEQLDPSVTARVPVHVSYDDRYFQDAYQAMPRDGYVAMFRRMIDHPNVELRLGTDRATAERDVAWGRMIYTGEMDAYFGHRYGKLPYRSLRFELRHHAGAGLVQPVAQVNHPNDHAYTRTTEFRHATGQDGAHGSTIAVEYPQPHVDGVTEAYYPIPQEKNRELYKRYEEEARKLAPKVLFAGRLADYQYYNMDQAVARALSVYDAIAGQR